MTNPKTPPLPTDTELAELRAQLRDELRCLRFYFEGQLHDPLLRAMAPDLHRWHQEAFAKACAQLRALDLGKDVAPPETMWEYVAGATRMRVELEISPWSELRTFVSDEPDALDDDLGDIRSLASNNIMDEYSWWPCAVIDLDTDEELDLELKFEVHISAPGLQEQLHDELCDELKALAFGIERVLEDPATDDRLRATSEARLSGVRSSLRCLEVGSVRLSPGELRAHISLAVALLDALDELCQVQEALIEEMERQRRELRQTLAVESEDDPDGQIVDVKSDPNAEADAVLRQRRLALEQLVAEHDEREREAAERGRQLRKAAGFVGRTENGGQR